MARDSYGRPCRPGVLAVSPPEYPEMPDEYMDKARAELLADNEWLADQIGNGITGPIARAIMDGRDGVACEFIRATVQKSIDREIDDLAESLWMRDIEESQQAAAEYAADRD
jgi:hypothetical protein